MSPWRRNRVEERRETLALVALAESTLRQARERLAEIEAREHENVRLDALDATVRARMLRAETQQRGPDDA